jgi:hypothetical protein
MVENEQPKGTAHIGSAIASEPGGTIVVEVGPEPDQFSTELTEVNGVLDSLALLQIRDQEDLDAANGYLEQVKDEHRRIKADRDAIARPARQAIEELDKRVQPVLKAYQAAEKILKDKISFALAATQQAQDRALEAVGEGARDSDVLAVAHGENLLETPDNVSVIKAWGFEITDPEQVPREFCEPDTKRIRAYIGAKKGQVEIPGVRVFQEDQVRQRRS